jgi:hypothetical protein
LEEKFGIFKTRFAAIVRMSRRGGATLNGELEGVAPPPGNSAGREAEASSDEEELPPLHPFVPEGLGARADVVMDQEEEADEEEEGHQGEEEEEEEEEEEGDHQDQEEERSDVVPPITIARDSAGLASLASASAELWVGAIFYVRINGGKDAVQIRSKGKLKDSGFNRQEYREFPLVINGDDVNPLAVTMRFEELSEKRSVNTATKYGMDDCQRGAKRLWVQYCHTEQGMELWGQTKMTGRTDLL